MHMIILLLRRFRLRLHLRLRQTNNLIKHTRRTENHQLSEKKNTEIASVSLSQSKIANDDRVSIRTNCIPKKILEKRIPGYAEVGP